MVFIILETRRVHSKDDSSFLSFIVPPYSKSLYNFYERFWILHLPFCNLNMSSEDALFYPSLPDAATITLPQFSALLSVYPFVFGRLVEQDTKAICKTGGLLGEILGWERDRYETLPGVMREERMKNAKGHVSMAKRNVQDLMSWKLYAVDLRVILTRLEAYGS